MSQVFKAMDRDQDGRLNMSDISQTLELAYDTCKNEFKQEHKDDQDNIETIELTLEDVKGLIEEQLNVDGCLEFSQFIVKAIDQKELISYEKLASAFRHFDKDGSGLVEAQEWITVLNNCKCSEEERREFTVPKNARCFICGQMQL